MTRQARQVDTVVKVGGGLLGRAGTFDQAVDAIAAATRDRRVLLVPGGGPFADAVRHMFRRMKIGEDAAHWMAILGMDQYAHALSARLGAAATLVEDTAGVAGALDAGRVPVMAPYRWLRSVDPLPHTWEVTSDSIAAWIAGALGARQLVLLKPARADHASVVDPYFARTLPAGVDQVIITADALGQLEPVLAKGEREGRSGGNEGRGGRRSGERA